MWLALNQEQQDSPIAVSDAAGILGSGWRTADGTEECAAGQEGCLEWFQVGGAWGLPPHGPRMHASPPHAGQAPSQRVPAGWSVRWQPVPACSTGVQRRSPRCAPAATRVAHRCRATLLALLCPQVDLDSPKPTVTFECAAKPAQKKKGSSKVGN